MRSVSLWLVALAGTVLSCGAMVGCGSGDDTGGWGPSNGSGSSGSGGSSSSSSGGSSSSSSGGNSSSSSSGGGNSSSSSGGASSSSSGGNASSSSGGGSGGSSGGSGSSSGSGSGSGSSSGSGGGSGSSSGSVSSNDGFSASRTACINKINALRATDTAVALQPLMLQNDDATNTCVDTQASNDQAHMSAHYSFINNAPACMWGSAMGWAQNECETGYGTDPGGIEQCLQDMWDESLKPNCAGCIGCTQFGGACANCDYSGSKGYECGHYVNMSAPYFTSVACGFGGAAPSSTNAWAVQNFE